ncbi:MAG: hypothetical protein A3D35_02675 [Candidatus Staskawiczbacteria bacterium RIFCSPHIGHO2_02_FULL_34_9]|uniref:AAA+ ATPase domain-containing protein n=2 Tax=Candidatus Staskawicziibacteriota TaxID=1817916 RepID=A0A1G2I2X3_9BACT|nr:MAG: hypothetical protein A3D35_02675 [Candidatus Staskawiczbacteria bacterium RIFCSPHIGHO2_02_FULL_34_9]
MLCVSCFMMLHQKQWNFLKDKFENNQFSHAYLFSGPKETGKTSFAKELVKLINRSIPNGEKMIESGNFPDLKIIRSKDSKSSLENEKDMMSIEIEQIRDVQDFLSLTTYYGNYKAVIVQDAERMTLEAENCFLKTLEEPKGKTIIILTSSKPNLLLQTVTSRCQEIRFFYNEKYEISKDEELIIRNLEKVMNSSLAEKFQYTKNANLDSENFEKILMALRKHFRELMLDKIMGKEVNYTISKIKNILELIEYINSQSYITNVNNKLALEVLLMEI